MRQPGARRIWLGSFLLTMTLVAGLMLRAGPTASQTGQAAVAEAIQARDLSDKTRAASPLSLARGAVHIDTTNMPIDVVVNRVLTLVREKLDQP